METEAALLVQEGLAALFEAAGMGEHASRELDAIWAAAAGSGDEAGSGGGGGGGERATLGGSGSRLAAAAGGDGAAGRTGLPFFSAAVGPGDERARLLPPPGGEGAVGALPSIAQMSSLVPTGSLSEFELLQRCARHGMPSEASTEHATHANAHTHTPLLARLFVG